MPRMILKWRYFKSNQSSHKDTFVKYIATRDGVEKCENSWKNKPATAEQKRLVNNLAKDFPNTKDSFEYKEFQKAETKYNASQYISKAIDENLDIIGKKENYIGYIAKRPRVEKQGKHGLFSQKDEEINLEKVASEVANHKGVVWNTIISLKRKDAQKLAYDNAKVWRDMLRSNANLLAESMEIPFQDLRWYAAFHNEGTHPHIHLVTYSVGEEPYMTEEGLMRFKSELAKKIFKQDLYTIFEEQNRYRNDLRKMGRDKIKEIVEQINQGTYTNENIEILLGQLTSELGNYTGKKVYGYLPKRIKNIVNGIVDEIEKDKNISELYRLWYEQKDNIVSIYQDAMTERVPLATNNEFKSIRNAIIQEAERIRQEIDMAEPTAEKEEKKTKEGETRTENDTNDRVEKPVINEYVTRGVIRLLYQVSRTFQDEFEKNSGANKRTDRKMLKEIDEKKQAQGQKFGG
ncbi:MAG: hypothetical protein IKJ59_13100 [Clostridia bacterium]|nr:hypothetical protein [Clostridia bacterium]